MKKSRHEALKPQQRLSEEVELLPRENPVSGESAESAQSYFGSSEGQKT